MISLTAQRRFEATIKAAELLLANWRLIASSDGRLIVQPLGPCLTYSDVQVVWDRLREALAANLFTEVVIGFGLVECLTAPWTPVFALIVELARELTGRCRVVGLHGQPAAVAELLLGGCRLGVLSLEYAESARADDQAGFLVENVAAA